MQTAFSSDPTPVDPERGPQGPSIGWHHAPRSRALHPRSRVTPRRQAMSGLVERHGEGWSYPTKGQCSEGNLRRAVRTSRGHSR